MSAVLVKNSASKPKKETKQRSVPSATAFHADDGDTHIVGIGNLRVIICKDGSSWFAQGLEIDYAADGKTLKEVKENFQSGLEATIDEHLKVYGTIQQILIPAPKEVWQDLASSGKHMRYSQVTLHDPNLGDEFPYSGIDYIERTEEASA